MESQPLGIQQDDVVCIIDSGQLAFVEHVGGETSDEDDDEETESESSFEQHPLFQSYVFQSPFQSAEVNARAPVDSAVSGDGTSQGLINRYDDDYDDSDRESEPDEAASPSVQTITRNAFQAPARAEELDSRSVMAQREASVDSAEQVPVGFARVMLIDACEQKVLPIEKLRVEDRAFIPGDIVYKCLRNRLSESSSAEISCHHDSEIVSDEGQSPVRPAESATSSPNHEQSAIVIGVSKSLLVRPVLLRDIRSNALSRRASTAVDPGVCEISSKDLRFFSGLRDGCFVVSDEWVGRVTFLTERVRVQFSNGGVCQLPANPETLVPVDLLKRVPVDDIEGIYYPGQIVKAEPSVWKSAHWLSGSYTRQRRGSVIGVEVTHVGVDWIAKKCSDEMSSEDGQVPPDILSHDRISPLIAFQDLWWRVGDRGRLHREIFEHSGAVCSNAGEQNLSQMSVARGSNLLEDNSDDWEEVVSPGTSEQSETWEQDVCVGMGSTSKAVRAFPRKNRSSIGNGRLLAAQRRMLRNQSRHENSDVANERNEVVVEVVSTRTYLDLLWQDGSISSGTPAVSVLTNHHMGSYDFFPGMFVSESKDDLDESSETVPDSSEKRCGVVVTVSTKDRTAIVRWQDAVSCNFGPEEEVSVYELSEQSVYDVQLGDTVLRIPIQKSVNSMSEDVKERDDWVGEVVGTGIGTFVVQWHQGGREEVTPDNLLVVGDADDEDDEDDEDDDDTTTAESDDMNGEPGYHSPGQASVLSLAENWALDPDSASTYPPRQVAANPSRPNSADDRTLEGAISNWISEYLSESRARQPFSCRDPEHTGATAANDAIVNVSREEDPRLYIKIVCKVAVERAGKLAQEVPGLVANQVSPLMSDTESKLFWDRVETVLRQRVVELVGNIQAPTSSSPGEVGQLSASTKVKNFAEVAQSNLSAERVTTHEPCENTTRVSPDPINNIEEQALEFDAHAAFVGEDRFVVVDNFSGHQYEKGDTVDQPLSPGFHAVIRKEWSRLSRHLPLGIYVHASETRVDLLRCAIVGPSDTPYENVMFFFDILLPAEYPATPPKVHFMSHGRRLNPNLYEDGKVCLSILGTWDGEGVEKWDPRHSNVLRVLLSLQAMVFVDEPYFNEAGYDKQNGTGEGRINSRRYNESVLLLSLRHIVSSLREGGAPVDFVDLMRRHYLAIRSTILSRCRSLLNDRGCTQNGDSVHDEKLLQTRTVLKKSSDVSIGFCRSLALLLPKVEAALNVLR